MTNEELWAAGKLPELWEAVKRLLYQLAWKYYLHRGNEACARHGVTLEDLQQECYFAFLDAVRAYKPEKGFRFTSYLSRHAKNRFRICMGLIRSTPLSCASSLNAPIGEDGETESGDLLPDEQAEAELKAVDNATEQEYFREHLEAALADLAPIQAAVIRGKYYRRQTNKQIAETLHITPEEVCRLEAASLRSLRKNKIVSEIWKEWP